MLNNVSRNYEIDFDLWRYPSVIKTHINLIHQTRVNTFVLFFVQTYLKYKKKNGCIFGVPITFPAIVILQIRKWVIDPFMYWFTILHISHNQ